MNQITITGKIGKEPEFRTTSGGKSMVTFSVAVKKQMKPSDGPDSDWFNITAWDKTADFVVNYLHKGSGVAIVGRMESRKFTDKDGNNREAWSVIASSVEGTDRRDDSTPNAKPKTAQPAQQVGQDYDPFEDD